MITIEPKTNGIEVRSGDKLIMTNREDLHKAIDLLLDGDACTLTPYQKFMINGCPTCE